MPIDWPPPTCQPCQDHQHHLCQPVPWCECAETCTPLLKPPALPQPREGT